jgi:hypothetical protein
MPAIASMSLGGGSAKTLLKPVLRAVGAEGPPLGHRDPPGLVGLRPLAGEVEEARPAMTKRQQLARAGSRSPAPQTIRSCG